MLQQVEVEEQNRLLCKAACDILCQATAGCDKLKFVHIDEKSVCLEHSQFHSKLKYVPVLQLFLCQWTYTENYVDCFFRVEQVNKDSIETFFNNHISFMRDTFGVLLFLYTVMHSKVK